MGNYNGWTNYATWRVNLELLDGYETSIESNPEDYTQCVKNESISNSKKMEIVYNLSKELESVVEEIMNSCNTDSIVRSYADAFVSNVNWYEIAERKFDDVAEQIIELANENA